MSKPQYRSSTTNEALSDTDGHQRPPTKTLPDLSAFAYGSTSERFQPRTCKKGLQCKTRLSNSTTESTDETEVGANHKRRKVCIGRGTLRSPSNFESTYSLVKELRSDRTAPVDVYGPASLAQKDRGNVVYRFQLLIALILSSQTKDSLIAQTMKELQQLLNIFMMNVAPSPICFHEKHGLDANNVCNTPHDVLVELIKKVGFYNNKATFIKQAAAMIISDFNGDIPSNVQDMSKLPGVGPKVSYILENIAFNKVSGIGVDTHMHRLFNMINWVESKTPEETRRQLECWLPKDLWSEVTVLWVGLGQEAQQQQEKLLTKATKCSRPIDALRLLQEIGMDCKRVAAKVGLKKKVSCLL